MDQLAWGSWKRDLGEIAQLKMDTWIVRSSPARLWLVRKGDVRGSSHGRSDAITETAFRTSKTASPTSKTEQLVVAVTPPPPSIIELQNGLVLIGKTKWDSGSSQENTSWLAGG